MTQLTLNDLETSLELDQEALEGLAGGHRRGRRFYFRHRFCGYKHYYKAYYKHDYYYPKYYYYTPKYYYGCYNH